MALFLSVPHGSDFLLWLLRRALFLMILISCWLDRGSSLDRIFCRGRAVIAPYVSGLCRGPFGRVYFVSVDYDTTTAKPTPTFFAKLWTIVYPSNLAPFGLKLCQNAFQTIPDILFFDAEKKSANFSDRKISFSSIWLDFRGAGAKWTSKSASASNFALDTSILRSVRPKIMKMLRKPCENVVKMLWKPCENLVKTLWTPCENLVEMLWKPGEKPCENIVKTLWKCCENLVKTLWTCCENLVNMLWKHVAKWT